MQKQTISPLLSFIHLQKFSRLEREPTKAKSQILRYITQVAFAVLQGHMLYDISFHQNIENWICPLWNETNLVNTTSALLINLKTITMGEADFCSHVSCLKCPKASPCPV